MVVSHELQNAETQLLGNPRLAQMVGLAASTIAFLLCLGLTAAGLNWWALWLVPLLIGLAGAGAAVAVAPQSSSNLAWAGAAAGLAFFVALRSGWDISAPFLFGTLSILAFVAALLMVLPQLVRRVAISLFIVYHFAGIFCAITSAPPQTWVTGQLFEVLFRPYLQAVYLTNAYHFYAPEPGPATMLWFRLEYEPDEDGTRYSRWVKIPNLDEKGRAVDYDALGKPRRIPRVEYTRRLSIVENASAPGLAQPGFEKYKNDRMQAGAVQNIPWVQNMPLEMQYREPAPVGKLWLSIYVRHVARTYKHEKKPEKAVTAVKVYRVTHEIMRPFEVAGGRSFEDPSTYHPYYQGEFEPDGTMKKSCREVRFDDNGNMAEVHRDPFLYWEIPIVAELTPQTKNYDYKITNYLRKHAGDTEGTSLP